MPLKPKTTAQMWGGKEEEEKACLYQKADEKN